jgi:hypothetical protein
MRSDLKPHPDPELLVRVMNPRIRIRTKISWIYNTGTVNCFRYWRNENVSKKMNKFSKKSSKVRYPGTGVMQLFLKERKTRLRGIVRYKCNTGGEHEHDTVQEYELKYIILTKRCLLTV